MRSASAAPIGAPVRISSIALPLPTRRGSRCVPPYPGSSAEIDLRLTDPRRVGGDAKRARHRQLAPAAQRVAVDRRDHRLAEILDEIEDVLPGERMLAAGRRRLDGELVDVGPGDERLVAGAGQDDDANGFVAASRSRMARPQLVERGRVERVENLRPVDRDDGDGAVALDQKVVKGHGGHELYPTPSPDFRDRRPPIQASAAIAAPTASATTSIASAWRGGTKYCGFHRSPRMRRRSPRWPHRADGHATAKSSDDRANEQDAEPGIEQRRARPCPRLRAAWALRRWMTTRRSTPRR